MDDDEHNVFKFFKQAYKNINNPIMVDNYPPALTNFLIFSSLISGVGLTYFGIQSIIKSQKTVYPPLPQGYEFPTEEEKEGYSENIIDMDLACNSKGMRNKAKEFLEIPMNVNMSTESISVRMSDNTKIWPVYRWGCIYKVTSPKETITPLIGIDLKEYCQVSLELGKKYNYGYKDYLNPNSFYCTRIDNNAINPKL